MTKFLHFLLFLIFCNDSFAEKVNLRGQGIVDDEIALSIKSPCPLSVSKAIEYIENTYKDRRCDIEVLDFRNNNITWGGARKILDFARELPNLKKISFHTNRIYDWRGQEGFEDFEKSLVHLLDTPTFNVLDIRINGIANISWYQYICTKTQNAYKIKWVK